MWINWFFTKRKTNEHKKHKHTQNGGKSRYYINEFEKKTTIEYAFQSI